MKWRNLISMFLFCVYALVMAHSFVPHHHHSEHQENSQHCKLEQPSEHNCEHDHHDESHHLNEDCCVDNEHNQTHTICNFEEKTVLTKGIGLADLFLPSVEIQYFDLLDNKQSWSNYVTINHIQDSHCRDVWLRGPPQFS